LGGILIKVSRIFEQGEEAPGEEANAKREVVNHEPFA
jgi:hypothetical protein